MFSRVFNNPAGHRVVPFIIFMSFIALEESIRALHKWQLISVDDITLYWLYPPKAILTGVILILLWQNFTEIDFSDLLNFRSLVISLVTGALIFILWIKMDWTLSTVTPPSKFDPRAFDIDIVRWGMIFIRIIGAVLVVPVMEELFWRSFLLRYLISNDFLKVPIGKYSLMSCIVVIIFFGLEHHYIIAGMMAGLLFNLLLYYTKSIVHCIVSHAVANACLAAYVLYTGHWHFW